MVYELKHKKEIAYRFHRRYNLFADAPANNETRFEKSAYDSCRNAKAVLCDRWDLA